jgi:hypothetical protein
MNAKANSIEIVSATIAAGRIQREDRPVVCAIHFRAVSTSNSGALTESRLGPPLFSTNLQAGEFWETLTYVTIWLCGLIGIVLCLMT